MCSEASIPSHHGVMGGQMTLHASPIGFDAWHFILLQSGEMAVERLLLLTGPAFQDRHRRGKKAVADVYQNIVLIEPADKFLRVGAFDVA